MGIFRGDRLLQHKTSAVGFGNPQDVVSRQGVRGRRRSLERRKCAVCAELCSDSSVEARFVRVMCSRTPVCSEGCWRAWLTTVTEGNTATSLEVSKQESKLSLTAHDMLISVDA